MHGQLCLYQATNILVPSGLQVVPSGTQVWLIVFQFYAHINLSETVQERVMMILLDKLVVKIIRLKIPAMQDLICKKPNCQEA